MPTLTIHMAPIWTPLANGKTSTVGHMFYTIDNGSGSPPLSYGFAPVDGATGIKKAFGPGDRHTNDNTQYLNTDPTKPIITKTITITDAQYTALKNFGENPAANGFSTFYNGLTNSCIDFTWKAMQAAGLSTTQYQGAMLPSWNAAYVQDVWDELQRTRLPDWVADISVDFMGQVTVHPICRPDGKFRYIAPDVNTSTKTFITYQPPPPPPPPRDPLILDLDGGGISATPINTLAPIYFDKDADGTRTATGWIAAGEGIVVRDLNGNGLIDTGRELFGDGTMLTRGPRAGQLAANGFEALADLDTNLDNKFDASDVAFNSVKLWKDANQNGVSEAGELFSFAQLGVQSVGLSYTVSGVSLGSGNFQVANGSFTRLPAAGGGTALAGSLVLNDNFFYRQFGSNPALTATAQGSAQMQGSGWVRDLREAMSLGMPASATLQAKVNAFAAATTQVAHRAAVDEVVTAWSSSATRRGGGLADSASAFDHSFYINGYGAEGPADFGAVFGAALDARGFAWRSVPAYSSDRGQRLGQMLVDAGLVRGFYVDSSNGSPTLDLKTWSVSVAEAFALSDPATSAKIRALEAFNGDGMLDRFVAANGSNQQGQPISWRVAPMSTTQLSLLDNAYAALKETVYAGLVTQTRLKPYLDSIGLVIDANGVQFDTAAAVALIQAKSATSRLDAFADALDLRKYSGDILRGIGWDVNYTVKALVDAGPVSTDIQSLLTNAQTLVFGPTSTNFTNWGHSFGAPISDSTVLGNDIANVITGNNDRDFLYGMGGNDTLWASGDDDFLDGGTGNDTLGIAGTWSVHRTNFTGGTGDDVINGGFYENTFVFNLGDGKDTISNGGAGSIGHVLKFGAGIAVADVTPTRLGVDLVLKLANGIDQVTVKNWFANVSGSNQIEKLSFADGTVWTNTQLSVIAQTNQAPTATNLSIAEVYTEDTTKNLVDIVVADTDSANLTITLTLSNVAAGGLNVGTSGAVTSTFIAGTGVWTVSGAKADVNTLLAALTFNPAANFNGNFSIATSVSDGVAPAITGSKAFTGTAVNDLPTGGVTISGTATQGQTLTAANTLADVDGLGTISYQWKAAGVAISGATANTFLLTSVQVGQAITVSASYTDGKGTVESAGSSATAAVAALPNIAPTATNLSAAESYTEDTAKNLVDIVVADTDSANLTATLTLSNVAAGSLDLPRFHGHI